MLLLELSCPNPKCQSVLEYTANDDRKLDAFVCPECSRKGLVLQRMDLCTSAIITRRLGVLEGRLQHLEEFLTQHTSDDDVPFETDTTQ